MHQPLLMIFQEREEHIIDVNRLNKHGSLCGVEVDRSLFSSFSNASENSMFLSLYNDAVMPVNKKLSFSRIARRFSAFTLLLIYARLYL